MKAISKVLVRSLGVVLLVTAAQLDAAERMTPGQWEFTMTTNGASPSSKYCVDTDLAAVANGDSRSGREAAEKNSAKAKSNCTVTDFTAKGDTVSYAMTCGDRTIRSTSTYYGDRYEGVLKTKTATEETTTEVKARRLGACPK